VSDKIVGGIPPTVTQNTIRCALGLAPVLVGAHCMTLPVEPALTLMMITVTGEAHLRGFGLNID
jgi:hypothetical protein